MPRQVWMIADPQWGCPRSATIVVPGRAAADGTTFAYTFERNKATVVDEGDLEFVLQQTVMDKTNRPLQVFKTSPPRQDLNDADRLRMQIEKQGEQIDGLLQVLAANNPELAAKLAPATEDGKLNLLDGLVPG